MGVADCSKSKIVQNTGEQTKTSCDIIAMSCDLIKDSSIMDAEVENSKMTPDCDNIDKVTLKETSHEQGEEIIQDDPVKMETETSDL